MFSLTCLVVLWYGMITSLVICVLADVSCRAMAWCDNQLDGVIVLPILALYSHALFSVGSYKPNYPHIDGCNTYQVTSSLTRSAVVVARKIDYKNDFELRSVIAVWSQLLTSDRHASCKICTWCTNDSTKALHFPL